MALPMDLQDRHDSLVVGRSSIKIHGNGACHGDPWQSCMLKCSWPRSAVVLLHLHGLVRGHHQQPRMARA